MISTLTSKKGLMLLLLMVFVSTASAEFYYNDQGEGFSSDGYFETPEFDSQQDIATELVAPFIFITILLHFALSRALNFILAEDIEEERYHAVPYSIPLREGYNRKHPDATRYSMIMSLAITGSLVPTPYWGYIRGLMGALGAISMLAFAAMFIFVLYMMAKVHG